MLQEPRPDPRGAGHVRCRMPRPDATPRCVGRQELCNRVGELPSSPRLGRRQGGHGRSASRRQLAVLEIQRCAIARRSLAFACICMGIRCGWVGVCVCIYIDTDIDIYRYRYSFVCMYVCMYIALARRRLAFACADCMITASPCRAEPSALVRKQHPESDASSCAAMLRDCRAHSTARRRQISGGEPLASRLPSISTLSRTCFVCHEGIERTHTRERFSRS
jgi:hypothetical protein